MLENFIYGMPWLILLLGIFSVPLFSYFSKSHTLPWHVTEFFVLASFFFEVVFYNKPINKQFFAADYYTLLFSCVIYVCALSLLLLARRWHSSMSTSGTLYCEGLLVGILSGNILIDATNFAFVPFLLCGLMLGNYLIFRHSDNKKGSSFGFVYALSCCVCGIILILCSVVLGLDNGSLQYTDIEQYLLTNNSSFAAYILVLLLVFCFVFILGAAPLHFWYTETLGQTILPVMAYFTLFPPIVIFSVWNRFNMTMFMPFHTQVEIIYGAIALLSMFGGALGACSVVNIRKIISYGSMYHFGMMILLMQNFKSGDIVNLTIYLLVFLLATYGIMVSLFGLKSKGEYLFMLNDLSGAARKKPYVSAMITAYLFSLVGFPPFLGFIGLFNSVHNLVINNHPYMLFMILGTTAVLVFAYLQIIRTLYFARGNNVYDRTERGIYAVMLFNALLMLSVSLKPEWLIANIKFMTEGTLG